MSVSAETYHRLEAQWALERSARLAAEAANEKLSDAFRRQNSSMEFRWTKIKVLKKRVEELELALQMSQRSQEGVQDAWLAEQDKVFALKERCALLAEQVEAALELYGKACAERDGHITSLEDVLAATAENLLAYRDYYGTTIAQVKHLQECTQCCSRNQCSVDTRYSQAGHSCHPCPDYPTE
jgi:hypothetical protein